MFWKMTIPGDIYLKLKFLFSFILGVEIVQNLTIQGIKSKGFLLHTSSLTFQIPSKENERRKKEKETR